MFVKRKTSRSIYHTAYTTIHFLEVCHYLFFSAFQVSDSATSLRSAPSPHLIVLLADWYQLFSFLLLGGLKSREARPMSVLTDQEIIS